MLTITYNYVTIITLQFFHPDLLDLRWAQRRSPHWQRSVVTCRRRWARVRQLHSAARNLGATVPQVMGILRTWTCSIAMDRRRSRRTRFTAAATIITITTLVALRTPSSRKTVQDYSQPACNVWPGRIWWARWISHRLTATITDISSISTWSTRT